MARILVMKPAGELSSDRGVVSHHVDAPEDSVKHFYNIGDLYVYDSSLRILRHDSVEALDIKFDQEAYTAPAGPTDIAYVSEAQQVHTLVVFDDDNQKVGETMKVNPGQTQVEAFDLPAGTYTLVCDIPGHKDAGMVATLTTS